MVPEPDKKINEGNSEFSYIKKLNLGETIGKQNIKSEGRQRGRIKVY